MIRHAPSIGLGIGLSLRGSGARFSGILDQYAGAAIAFSFQTLTRDFLGKPLIRVRRSSDNAELDLNQTEIEDGTLLSWVGAGDGFLVTWYDQSGNGNDLNQATTAEQRKVVDAGALVTEGGNLALAGNIYAMNLTSNVTISMGNFTIAALGNHSSVMALLGGGGLSPRYRFTGISQLEIVASNASEINFNSTTALNNYEFDGTRKLLYLYGDGSGATLNINAEDTLDSPLTGLTGNSTYSQVFGRTGDTNPYTNKFQELIIWPSDIR